MHRFFVDENCIKENQIIIEGSDVNHIANVLRMQIGETILISDGKDNEYVCEIASISEEQVVATIVDMSRESRELPIKVVLFQGLPKGDKMDTIIEKNIELGISEIVPVRMSRCVVKLDDQKAAKKVTKWNAKAEAAAKQSKRGIVPSVGNVVSYDEALKRAQHLDSLNVMRRNTEQKILEEAEGIVDKLENQLVYEWEFRPTCVPIPFSPA